MKLRVIYPPTLKSSKLLFFFLVTVSFATIIPVAAQKPVAQYLGMKESPKRLFDKWAFTQNTIENQELSAQDRFQLLHISRRSTFAAITNALLYTKLTDQSGRSLGFAIDLIEEIEDIAGQNDEKGGDEQFRLYVKLKSDVLKKLDLSREFSQGKDNTVFHKGFPINYRQLGNAPTLQYSISADRQRADIDIDYHSSKFPKVLFNGHLTAANSDVRVSNNYFTHLKRWIGLINWWDSVFPDLKKSYVKDDRVSTLNFLPANHEDAPESEIVSATANSFLNLWLVERDLDRAMSFLQNRLTFCSDINEVNEKQLMTNRYKFLFLDMLKVANKELKKSKTLEQSIRPVIPVSPYIKAVDHPQKNAYTLAVVTDGDYKHFVCTSKTSEQTAKNQDSESRNYGKYYVVKFQFALENGNGGILRLLWSKTSGSWKIEAFDAVTA